MITFIAFSALLTAFLVIHINKIKEWTKLEWCIIGGLVFALIDSIFSFTKGLPVGWVRAGALLYLVGTLTALVMLWRQHKDTYTMWYEKFLTVKRADSK